MKKKLLCSVLSTLMVATLLYGCGSAKNSQSAGKSNTLTFAQGADPKTLDPAYGSDGESAKIIVNIYEGLLKYKKDSTEIEPCLAEKWDISKDGKTYTFHLRKGVKFQDGTDFNADAVKFNIERQLPPKVSSDMAYASFTYGEVDKVETVDEYTVKIILKEAYTPFLSNLAMCLAAPMVSPTAAKKYGNNLVEHPVGTGPFKFVKWQKGQYVELVKNDDYWGDKAKSDKLIFKFIKENSVRASELMAGSIDIMDGLDPNDIQKLKDNNQNIFEAEGMNTNYMAFNCSRAPFNDPKLREAIVHAIDREELVKFLYQGYSQVADSVLPEFIPGFDDSIKQGEYDPAKAKQMLKELGKENIKIKMITYSNPKTYNPVNGQKLAEAVQNYLKKVGIESEIAVYDWTTYLTKVTQGEGDIAFLGWVGDNGDADNFLSLFDSKEIKSSLNIAKYSNAKVDQLLKEGKKLPNGDERNKIYSEIEKIVSKDAAWLPISHAKTMAAYSPKVKNFTYHPTGVVFLKDTYKEQ